MGKNNRLNILSGSFFGTVALLFITVGVSGNRPASAQGNSSNIVSGSGNISNRVHRCVLEVISDCGDGVQDFNGDSLDDTTIVINVRETQLDICSAAVNNGLCGPDNTTNCNYAPPNPFPSGVAYTGLISNAFEDGHQSTIARAESCSRPNQVSQTKFSLEQLLENATVAGITGDLEITVNGTAKGDIKLGDPNAKVITSGSISIRGVEGTPLEGLTGHGALDGESWFNGSFSDYTAKIKLPD